MRPGSRDAVQPEAKQKVTTLFIFQFPRTLLSRILMGMSVQIRRGHNELARKTTVPVAAAVAASWLSAIRVS